MYKTDRDALKKNCIIELKDETGSSHTYLIKEFISGQGASCLSYIAASESGKEFVLKEFYPQDSNVSRFGVNLDISLVEQEKKEMFLKGIDNLKTALDIPGLGIYIAAEIEDARLLKGNGSLYYTNKRIVGEPLIDIVSFPDAYPELILLSIGGIVKFLKLLHDEGFAYPDLKAEDILIPYNQDMRCYQFDRPLFYDFDAMTRFGVYDEVASTYGPFKKNKGPFSVDQISENMTLAKLLDQVIIKNEDFQSDRISTKINKEIRQLPKELRNKKNVMEDDTAIIRIEGLVESIQIERKLMEKPGFKRENSLIHRIRTLTCFLVSVIYLLIGAVLFSMFFSPEFTNRIMDRYYDINLLLAGNVLLCFVILFLLYKIYSYTKKDYDDSINHEKGVNKYEQKKNADIKNKNSC